MKSRTETLTGEYMPGHILFHEKDPGDCMYVIRTGRVKIYREFGQSEIVLAFLGPGDFLGEMALLEGLPRSASAVVMEPSSLVRVDMNTFEEMVRRNIEVAVRMMKKLAARVRSLDRRVENLMVDSAQGRALDVLRWLTPQGMLEGHWVRIAGLAKHFDIAAHAAIPKSQAESVIRQLVTSGCLRVEGDDLLVAEKKTLDTYQHFLELKKDYETLEGPQTSNEHRTAQTRAIRRLMHALKLSETEVEVHQKNLAGKYERYLELKDRFKGFDADS